MNYELQVNALRLSLFYRHCSLCLSRGYFCRVLQAKSEFNAEVNPAALRIRTKAYFEGSH